MSVLIMFLRLTLLCCLLITVPVTAASTVFQAAVTAFDEPSISEASPLHFGSILNTSGSTCSLDNSGTVSGACVSANANISVGLIDISGLLANQEYQIEVVGSDNGILRFQPAITVDSIVSTDSDGDQSVSVTTIQPTDTMTISVHGNLEVLSELQSSDTYQASYTVNVNFQ
ncbi:hypothetical protein LHL20_03870 [Alteromonas sp. McT4-15]|uniref:hypothetical protein n=1 Tax=Alteromonas sp. McT4-15 TaxID=2881256 RepID=UPI001CF7EE97|nr:hypothetical protein [Alteromonas sp. McT4-15]MCB4435378.1 hypothetical protein [Alteromonas sp. McT4-15]